MNSIVLGLVAVLIITNFYLLSSSRLAGLIRGVGFQGILLATLPLFLEGFSFDFHRYLIAGGSLVIKGILIPTFLMRALRGLPGTRETHPYVGYTASIVICIIITAASFYGANLTRALLPFAGNMIPAALSLMLCGLFLIVARSQALGQVIGYLVFENGIYVFGLSIAVKNPVLVELGVLLDVLVGVFVMGIVVHQISREFDTISMPALGGGEK